MAETRWFRTMAALLGIVIPGIWFYSVVTPGEEAVKIRNGLVARMGQVADFTWTPNEMPSSFLVDRVPPTPAFVSVAKQLTATTSAQPLAGFELGLAISRYLMGAPKRVGGPIQSNLATAHEGITRRGRGYCADFTQVFTGIATAAGLPVRSWGISFESFGAGHTFNEVYDQQLGKWVLVDPFHSLYFTDPTTLEPLSVIEVHDRLLGLDGQARPIAIQKIVEDRFPFRSEAIALDYYRSGMDQLGLSWGSNVFDYDQSKPVRWSASVSRHLERAVAIAIGQYPLFVIYPQGVSQRDMRALARARDRFVFSAAALTLATFVFGWQLATLWIGTRK